MFRTHKIAKLTAHQRSRPARMLRSHQPVPGGAELGRLCEQHLSGGHAKLDPAQDGPLVVTKWRLRVPERWAREGAGKDRLAHPGRTDDREIGAGMDPASRRTSSGGTSPCRPTASRPEA